MSKLGYNPEKGNFSFKSRAITVSIISKTSAISAQVVSATGTDLPQRASALVLANQLDNTKQEGSEDILIEEDEYSVFIDSQEGSVNANFALINNTADDKLVTFDMSGVNGGKALFSPSTGVNKILVKAGELKFVGGCVAPHGFEGQFEFTGYEVTMDDVEEAEEEE